jgi:hypothetical protein
MDPTKLPCTTLPNDCPAAATDRNHVDVGNKEGIDVPDGCEAMDATAVRTSRHCTVIDPSTVCTQKSVRVSVNASLRAKRTGRTSDPSGYEAERCDVLLLHKADWRVKA